MELKEIAKNIMVSCLAVKPTEDVLIITDDSRSSPSAPRSTREPRSWAARLC